MGGLGPARTIGARVGSGAVARGTSGPSRWYRLVRAAPAGSSGTQRTARLVDGSRFDEFKALYAYSPLQNLRPGVRFPATLVTTADHDDRVVPAHSFKFAARLQEYHRGANPVLIRID